MEDGQLPQAVQELQRQLEQMNARVEAQAAEARQNEERYEVRLRELREVALQAARGEPRQHARRHGLVDTKGVGRPATFDGTQAKWSAWAFKVENFIASVYANGREALDWAGTRERMILDEDLKELQDLDTPDVFEINEAVYALIAQITEQEPLDIAKNTTRGAGLEVWRKLQRRYDPQTVGRKRAMLSRILAPGSAKIADLSAAIQRWEESVRVYQERSRENLSDDVRTGILIEMLPEALKNHVYLNQNRLVNYEQVKSEIETYLEARHGREAGAGADPGGAVPMDLSAFKGGKGKAKGKGQPPGSKGSKGKSKGKGKADTSSARGSTSTPKGPCWTCGKTGHVARDCRSGTAQPPAGPRGRGNDAGSPAAAGGAAAFQGYCGRCGRWGHRQSQCRAPAGSMEADGGAAAQAGDPATAGSPANGPPVDQGALMLGAVYNGIEYPDKLEEVEVIVDSGAAVSALPTNMCRQYPVEWHADKGRKYYAVNGATVEDEGRRAPELITADGKRRSIGFSVAEVRRALLSVSKSIDHGNRVIFDSEGSYVENKKSGERTAIERKNGVFTMKFWVAPKPVSGNAGVRALAPYTAETGGTAEGHPPVRQAWP